MPPRIWGAVLSLLFLGVWAQSAEAEEPAFVFVADAETDENVHRLIADPQYRFCQDPNYRLFQAEKDALCVDLAVFEERCPMLTHACQRPAWEADREEPSESWFDWGWLLAHGRWLAGLFKAIFWIALLVGVAFLLRALLRQAKHWKEERDLETGTMPALSPSSAETAVEVFRAQELLAMARAALERNEIPESLHLTYRATVRALSDAEWVKPHHSKTSGDYLRSLRKLENADLGLPVEDVRTHLQALDRERFGGAARREVAGGLLDRAAHIATQLVQAGAVLLILSSLGCDFNNLPESPHEPGAPRGHQLFEDLMATQALTVNRRMHRVTDVSEETASVVAIRASLREMEWETLRRWVNDGGHLVVAAPDRNFLDVFDITTAPQPCSAPLVAPDLSLVQFGEAGFFDGPVGGTVLAKCGAGTFAVSQEWGEGLLTLIAHDGLFENASLVAADNATLAMHLVGFPEGHVEYLGPWTGRGAQHPIESIMRAGFGWWVLHLLLLGLIYAWSQGKRLGTPTDPVETKRRAFTEHARALSLKYQRAGASGFALQSYAEWVYDNLRRRAPSTRADLKSLTRAVSSNPREAAQLKEALTSARRAAELGESRSEHQATFLRLKGAILGISEVSRKQTHDKD